MEIAHAVGAELEAVRALVQKGVLKGCDTGHCSEFIYTPRHARQDGASVTLVFTQPGPIWYSSRMVVDEYKRKNAGASTRFGANPLKSSPGQREGECQGDDI